MKSNVTGYFFTRAQVALCKEFNRFSETHPKLGKLGRIPVIIIDNVLEFSKWPLDLIEDIICAALNLIGALFDSYKTYNCSVKRALKITKKVLVDSALLAGCYHVPKIGLALFSCACLYNIAYKNQNWDEPVKTTSKTIVQNFNGDTGEPITWRDYIMDSEYDKEPQDVKSSFKAFSLDGVLVFEDFGEASTDSFKFHESNCSNGLSF